MNSAQTGAASEKRSNGNASSSSNESASDEDNSNVKPLSAAAPVSLATSSVTSASLANADATSPAVRPPLIVQPLQFARRAVGVGGMSPRNAPHASPRVNPSLTPRGTAAANQNLRLSDVTDSSSSSSDEQAPAETAPTMLKPLGVNRADSTQQLQQQPDQQPGGREPSRKASAQPVTAPGAIVSRQSSIAEEDEPPLQQQHVHGSKQGRMRPSPSDSVAVSSDRLPAAASNDAPLDEEQGPPFPEKVHTRCR
jgi:hypothetical protein